MHLFVILPLFLYLAIDYLFKVDELRGQCKVEVVELLKGKEIKVIDEGRAQVLVGEFLVLKKNLSVIF